MKQNKRIPRISTRGFYDLGTGKTIKKKPYDLYPKRFFAELGKYPEFTIMVHGLRNNKSDAIAKFRIAQNRLRQLGYRHPVIGFSYDSNTKGVQYKSGVLEATMIGRIIARKNGKNLAQFVQNFKKNCPHTKIRLMGHSLGTEVILYALVSLKHKKNTIESVYFFGSSITSLQMLKLGRTVKDVIAKKILNYYSLRDEVLKYAHEHQMIESPIGCLSLRETIPKYVQKQVRPRNHRFASYSSTLVSFP